MGTTSPTQLLQLTVFRGDDHRHIDVFSRFRPLAAMGGAGCCIPASRLHNVAMLQPLCRTTNVSLLMGILMFYKVLMDTLTKLQLTLLVLTLLFIVVFQLHFIFLQNLTFENCKIQFKTQKLWNWDILWRETSIIYWLSYQVILTNRYYIITATQQPTD